MEMPDLQRYNLNLNLIKNVEDTVVFMSLKVSFSIVSYKQEMRMRESANENKQFTETKTLISYSYFI